jgi:hypothetical protein
MESVSIIMNTYNENPQYLKEAINSYLNQKNVNVQLIISTIENDPSINIINNFYKNQHITLAVVNKNEHPGKGTQGIFYQLNNAIKYIKYNWFTYASSNDVAILTKLYDEISLCKKYNKKICYSNYYITDKNLNNKKQTKFNNYDYQLHLKQSFITDCALISTDILMNLCPFNYAEYFNQAYWDLFLRAYEKYGNIFIYNNKPTFYYRILDSSSHVIRNKNKYKKQLEIYQKRKLMMDHTKIAIKKNLIPKIAIKKNLIPKIAIKKNLIPKIAIKKNLIPNIAIKKNLIPNIAIKNIVINKNIAINKKIFPKIQSSLIKNTFRQKFNNTFTQKFNLIVFK